MCTMYQKGDENCGLKENLWKSSPSFTTIVYYSKHVYRFLALTSEKYKVVEHCYIGLFKKAVPQNFNLPKSAWQTLAIMFSYEGSWLHNWALHTCLEDGLFSANRKSFIKLNSTEVWRRNVHVSWDLRCRKIDSSQKYLLLKIKKPGFLFRILKANKIVHYFLAL